jgi:hypothetical protein
MNTQTIAAQNNAESNSYGGARSSVTQSGSSHERTSNAQSVFFGQ